jgi:ABC-type transporter Mla MlaB component
MLRITRTTTDDSTLLLRLEGKLLAPWAEALRGECAAAAGAETRFELELTQVSFVDATGLALLRDLTAAGVGVAACSRFVAQLLNLETL